MTIDTVTLPASASPKLVAYLNLLSEERLDSEEVWIKLGFAIYKFATDNSIDLKVFWLHFSSEIGPYHEDYAMAKWQLFQTAHDEDIGISTIKRWAKEDSPEEYMQLIIDDIPEIALINWQKGDYGLALISHHLLKDVLKLPVGRGRQSFLLFDDSRFVWNVAILSKVKLAISSALAECLDSIASKLHKDALLASDLSHKEVLNQRRCAVLNVIKYVHSNRGLSNIVSLGRDLFRC